MWTTKESYLDKGADYYEQRYQERVITRLKKRAKSLGLEVVEAKESSLSFWRVDS